MFTEQRFREYLSDFFLHDHGVLRDKWYTSDVVFESIWSGRRQGIDEVLRVFGNSHDGQIEQFVPEFVVISDDGQRGAALLNGYRFFTEDHPEQGAVAGDRLRFALIAVYRFRGDRVCALSSARLRFQLNPENWDAPPEYLLRLQAHGVAP